MANNSMHGSWEKEDFILGYMGR